MINKKVVLAADVGGTHVRLAVVDAQGHALVRQKLKAELSRLDPHEQAEERILDILATSLGQMQKQHPEVASAGIGFPGFFQGDSGVLISSPNLPSLHGFHLAEKLSRRLDMRVYVQNDALLAALGEFCFGAGRGKPSLLHLTLGTGVGGGLILSGRPYAGDGGMAMEIGHMRVVPQSEPDARQCGCGCKGCLEAYASATAVAARYAEASGHTMGAREVQTLAAEGNAVARQIYEDAGMYLGRVLAEAVKLLDVHHVSISGGLTGAWDLMWPSMQTALEHEVIPPLRGSIHVHCSKLGDDAGLLGAAMFAMDQPANNA